MTAPRVTPLPVEHWAQGLLDTAKAITNGGIRAEANVYCTLANYPAYCRPGLVSARTFCVSQVCRRGSASS